ncbi:hypothetical protein STEG23_025861, partial [Scotinomys teguina]
FPHHDLDALAHRIPLSLTGLLELCLVLAGDVCIYFHQCTREKLYDDRLFTDLITG